MFWILLPVLVIMYLPRLTSRHPSSMWPKMWHGIVATASVAVSVISLTMLLAVQWAAAPTLMFVLQPSLYLIC